MDERFEDKIRSSKLLKSLSEIFLNATSTRVMALRAGAQHLPVLFQPTRRTFLGWGGALAVGLAAVNWRSIAGGDIRAGPTLTAFRSLRPLNFRVISTTHSPLSLFSAISSNSPMALTPPQPPPAWDHSAEDITRLTKELIEKDRAAQDKVGSLAPKDCNFNSVRKLSRIFSL